MTNEWAQIEAQIQQTTAQQVTYWTGSAACAHRHRFATAKPRASEQKANVSAA